MPFTLCHPAAVLPIRRLFPERFELAALVIGSLTPDVGYYLSRFDIATAAHTFAGSFTLCLPVGALLLLLFYGLRRPVSFLLPMPHRGALLALCDNGRPFTAVRLIALIASLLIGAWTHIVWDAFTHETGWFVQRIAPLGAVWATIGTAELRGYYLLQQLSTLAGGVILIVSYRAWLRRDDTPVRQGGERWRYLLWSGMLLLACVVAVPAALRSAAAYDGFFAVRVFLFRAVVYYLAAVIPLVVLAALVIHTVRRRCN